MLRHAIRFFARLNGSSTDGAAERAMRRYREVRPELLEGSSIVFRTSETGEVFLQVCPRCRSIDVEAADWLGGGFRCRDCHALMVPEAGGGVRLVGEQDGMTGWLI